MNRSTILIFFLLGFNSGVNAQKKITSAAPRSVIIYRTEKNSLLRLTKTDSLGFTDFGQPKETDVCVFADPAHSFQSVTGIGGALTDASAETFALLPQQAQDELLTAYFDKTKGIGYTFARTNIHSCDFSSDSYTYVAENDTTLAGFSLQHDEKYRIPFIKKAFAAAQGNLKLFVSPWSPPAWMKTNNSMLNGGKLRPEFRNAWANYYVKFIRAYQKAGIPVWGLSVQNEPMATQRWESCIYTAIEERDFIRDYLGPVLRKNGLADKKLIAWDHNRDLVYQRASTLLDDPAAAKFIWGIGFHWYETWTGSTMQFENLQRVNEAFPKINLLLTEASIESFDFEKISDWALGERYGTSMIGDFNSGAVAWTDWNILVDEKGGPNHVGNFCFAPIIGDTRTGKLIYTNCYYYIGHFSKFIQPGAVRIVSSSNRDVLQTTAFKNPDGTLAVIVMNATAQAVPFRLWTKGEAALTTVNANSIITMVVK